MLSLSLSIINLYARDIFNKKLINKNVDTKQNRANNYREHRSGGMETPNE